MPRDKACWLGRPRGAGRDPLNSFVVTAATTLLLLPPSPPRYDGPHADSLQGRAAMAQLLGAGWAQTPVAHQAGQRATVIKSAALEQQRFLIIT